MGTDEAKYPPGDEAGVVGKPFRKALTWTAKLHAGQHRKGKPEVPYLSHLLGVAAIVLEVGGTETEAIAALLHDAIEDQQVGEARIRRRFGPRVVEIVRGCTDDLVGSAADSERSGPSAPARGTADWAARKAAFLARLRSTDDAGVLLVSAADKLHNARVLVADLRAGPLVWSSFNGEPVAQLEHYDSLRQVFHGRVPAILDHELHAAVDEMVHRTDLSAETAAWRAAHPELRPSDG